MRLINSADLELARVLIQYSCLKLDKGEEISRLLQLLISVKRNVKIYCQNYNNVKGSAN